jgi:hypothetical protein
MILPYVLMARQLFGSAYYRGRFVVTNTSGSSFLLTTPAGDGHVPQMVSLIDLYDHSGYPTPGAAFVESQRPFHTCVEVSINAVNAPSVIAPNDVDGLIFTATLTSIGGGVVAQAGQQLFPNQMQYFEFHCDNFDTFPKASPIQIDLSLPDESAIPVGLIVNFTASLKGIHRSIIRSQ